MMNRFTPDRRSLLKALSLGPLLVAPLQQARAAGLIGSDVCLLTPQVTEGPFYLDPGLVRRDVTEGRPGLPLDLAVQVVTQDCVPVPQARVDIWQCDALGVYSGVAGGRNSPDTTGQTFLRGTQMTDARGVATFATIFPGWYPGRTTHIHYKVFLPGGPQTLLTSQIFFDDAVSTRIFAQFAPYNSRGAARDTMNRADRIARRAGDGAYATVTLGSDRAQADMVVGVAET